jgi:hypothetical protein
MTVKTETKEREPQQPASHQYQPGPSLDAKYGSIGCAAIRAALQFTPATTAKAK